MSAIDLVLIDAGSRNDIPSRAELLRVIVKRARVNDAVKDNRPNNGDGQQEVNDQHNKIMDIVSSLRKNGELNWTSDQHDRCFLHLEKICLSLPRIYQLDSLMEEILDRFKTIQGETSKTSFKQLSLSKELPIKKFLRSRFTQDFIAILEMFDFKINYPDGIELTQKE